MSGHLKLSHFGRSKIHSGISFFRKILFIVNSGWVLVQVETKEIKHVHVICHVSLTYKYWHQVDNPGQWKWLWHSRESNFEHSRIQVLMSIKIITCHPVSSTELNIFQPHNIFLNVWMPNLWGIFLTRDLSKRRVSKKVSSEWV